MKKLKEVEMDIDRRIKANEFMRLMSVKKTKFYGMVKSGDIPEPVKLSEKEVCSWRHTPLRNNASRNTLNCAGSWRHTPLRKY